MGIYHFVMEYLQNGRIGPLASKDSFVWRSSLAFSLGAVGGGLQEKC